MENKFGDALHIDSVTLDDIKDRYSMSAILSDKHITVMPEGQQIGYLRGIADIIGYLDAIAEGGD